MIICLLLCFLGLFVTLYLIDLYDDTDSKYDPELNQLVKYLLKGLSKGTIKRTSDWRFIESTTDTTIDVWIHSKEYRVRKGSNSYLTVTGKRPSLRNRLLLKNILNKRY